MEVLKELVRNVVVIVMLTAFLDMILPSSTMRPYVKLAMGLFILVTLLTPILTFVLHDREFEVFAWQYHEPAQKVFTRQQDSERLLSVNQQLLRDDYARRLEVQMEALVRLVNGVETKIRVELTQTAQMASGEGIKSVVVSVTGRKEESLEQSGRTVTPVKIEISTPQNPSGREKTEDDTEDDRKQSPGQDGLSVDKKGLEKEIKNTLCPHFGLQAQQVRVIFG